MQHQLLSFILFKLKVLIATAESLLVEISELKKSSLLNRKELIVEIIERARLSFIPEVEYVLALLQLALENRVLSKGEVLFSVYKVPLLFFVYKILDNRCFFVSKKDVVKVFIGEWADGLYFFIYHLTLLVYILDSKSELEILEFSVDYPYPVKYFFTDFF
jgi:hypothetical protein